MADNGSGGVDILTSVSAFVGTMFAVLMDWSGLILLALVMWALWRMFTRATANSDEVETMSKKDLEDLLSAIEDVQNEKGEAT